MSWLTTCAAFACMAAAVVSGTVTPPRSSAGDTNTAPATEVSYIAPVDAEVLDRFRAPASRYGPGNRGVDYATTPGASVGAAASGVVVFAGPVAGSWHVTVAHADGVRTTYAFLQSVSVRRGQRVGAGEEVGRARESLHWSARAGDAYLDPLALLAAGGHSGRARLVPDGEPAPTARAPAR